MVNKLKKIGFLGLNALRHAIKPFSWKEICHLQHFCVLCVNRGVFYLLNLADFLKQILMSIKVIVHFLAIDNIQYNRLINRLMLNNK